MKTSKVTPSTGSLCTTITNDLKKRHLLPITRNLPRRIVLLYRRIAFRNLFSNENSLPEILKRKSFITQNGVRLLMTENKSVQENKLNKGGLIKFRSSQSVKANYSHPESAMNR